MDLPPEICSLDQCPLGRTARVTEVRGPDRLVIQLAEQGLFTGAEVIRLGTAPLGDPHEIRVGQTHLSLRTADAQQVLVRVLPPEL